MNLECVGKRRIRWTLKKKLLLWLSCIFLLVQLILIVSSTLLLDDVVVYIEVHEFNELVSTLKDSGSISEHNVNIELGGNTHFIRDDEDIIIRQNAVEVSDYIYDFLKSYPDQTYIKVLGNELILGAAINEDLMIVNTKQLAIIGILGTILNVYLGITTLLSFIALFTSTYFFLGYFMNPIIKIKDATKRIANFDFEDSLIINTNDELEDLANSINIMSSKLQLNMNKIIEKEVMFSLGETVDAHFSENGQHIERVSVMMHKFSKVLGYMDETCEMMKTASTMHDIGKIAISDKILKKPGKLTSDEFEIMKTHTLEGARILGKSYLPTMKVAAEIALNHHERIDGSGYPNQLSGEEIPKSARMMSIVDVFDALVNERVYKKAIEKKEAIVIIREGRGTQFDMELLDIFLENIEVITES